MIIGLILKMRLTIGNQVNIILISAEIVSKYGVLGVVLFARIKRGLN
jgi:hypothetical protein